ncbi:MAG: hypothetical protein PUC65_02175 [Clostridiales bacterium]|nr:hypothetical protein [Clostridiales bacterium]
MKKGKALFLSLVLFISMVMGVFTQPATTSYAASKASLSDTEYYMSAGTEFPEGNFFVGRKYQISVVNPVKKATYSFKSSNTKVLKVKAKGTTVYLTGVKAGTATITCTQKLNGKTTTVGKCKVKVSKAYLCNYGDEIPLGTNVIYHTYDSIVTIGNRNTSAKYTYKTNSKNLTMSEVKVDASESYGEKAYLYMQKYTAKKAGTYKVGVMETVGKTTKRIGTIEVTVVAPEYETNYELTTNEEFSLSNIIRNPMNNTYDSYSLEAIDFDPNDSNAIITTSSYEDDWLLYKGNKEGTAKFVLYYTTNGFKEKVCDVTVTIKDAVLEELYYSIDETIYIEDGKTYFSVRKDPWNAPGDITVTSSDDKIAPVAYDEEEECYCITPLASGSVTLTIACGDKKDEVNIQIKSYDDDYDY